MLKEIFTMVSGVTTKLMVSVSTNMLTVPCMKVSGKKTNKMAEERKPGLMEHATKVTT